MLVAEDAAVKQTMGRAAALESGWRFREACRLQEGSWSQVRGWRIRWLAGKWSQI